MSPSLLQLDLRGRIVVVIGGGPDAAGRATELSDAGAQVRVVWPEASEALADVIRSRADRVEWIASIPEPSLLQDAWLISLRSMDPTVDSRVLSWANHEHIWCEGSQDASAAVVPTSRMGTNAVAVTAAAGPDAVAGQAVASQLVEAALVGTSLRRPKAPSTTGSVVLVGGGPGDPELLTVRGRLELMAADVIVTDRLGPVDVLQEIGTGAAIIDVGKQPYHHPIPQDEINQLLITHAKQGKRVVRLKGGDPFLLGRGGEEVLACQAAGIPVSVIPGVTSALSAPLSAGIPATHRGRSTGVLIISGHDELNPAFLAKWPGTITVLMGMARLGELCASLVSAGMDYYTPVAVCASAWTPDARVVRGTLGNIQTRVANAGVSNPAVIVIGTVVGVLDPDENPSTSEHPGTAHE